MSKIIQPNIDYDIRLKMIHDECYSVINQSVTNFINDKTKSNYDVFKAILFDYFKKAKIGETPVTNQLKSNGIQVNSFNIGITDYNQSCFLNTLEIASNSYDDYINNTMFSKKYIVINDIQYVCIIKSAIYGYYGGKEYCHVTHMDNEIYIEPHLTNSIFIVIYCPSKDNIRVPNKISRSIPDLYPIIDDRLKAIHDELNSEVSNIIMQFINNKTETNYNILKNFIIQYLDKIIKCETDVTKQLKLTGNQINTPRIVISDCNGTFIVDTYHTSDNRLDSYFTYFTNIEESSNIVRRFFIEDVYALLYGEYGGIKFSYITKENIAFYHKSHGTNLSEPSYFMFISCPTSENELINDNIDKLEFIEDQPVYDIRLKMIQDEFVSEINSLIDNLIDDKTDDNYNILKTNVFDYLNRVINCSTPITKQIEQINSPRIGIFDCDFVTILDTYQTCNNTLDNYLNCQIYSNTPNHILMSNYIRTAFYGYHGGTKFSQIVQKNSNYYIQSHGPNLSQPTHYIGIACYSDENIFLTS